MRRTEPDVARAKVVQLCPLPARCPHCRRRLALPIVGNFQWKAAQRGLPVVCSGCKRRLNVPASSFDPAAFQPPATRVSDPSPRYPSDDAPEPSRAAPSDSKAKPSSASTSDAKPKPKAKRSFLDNVRTAADAVLTKDQQRQVVESVTADVKSKLGSVLDGIF